MLLCCPAVASAQHDIPASRDYVIDTAHVLQPDAIRAIDGWLQELQEKTGAQVKLLTVRTTGGEDFSASSSGNSSIGSSARPRKTTAA